ncbi:MAG TPA: DotU family type IV/VI secretion system protein [Herpetosiphonaceae bacterium]
MSNVVYAPPSLAATQGQEHPHAATQGAHQEVSAAHRVGAQPAPRLAQLCDPMLSLILSLQNPERLDNVPALYAQLQSQHAALCHQAALAGIDERDLHLATFALVAFADETIAESAWIDRAQWPFLQYEYFTTRRAGEQFFEQLQQIQGKKYDYAIWKDASRAELLEVYYLCLLLGFRGAWAFDPPLRVQHELEQIQRHVRARPAGRLAPNVGPRSYRNRAHGSAHGWMWLAILIQMALIAGLVMIHVK